MNNLKRVQENHENAAWMCLKCMKNTSFVKKKRSLFSYDVKKTVTKRVDLCVELDLFFSISPILIECIKWKNHTKYVCLFEKNMKHDNTVSFWKVISSNLVILIHFPSKCWTLQKTLLLLYVGHFAQINNFSSIEVFNLIFTH